MKTFTHIYIAGINRSGGSLLARLFDNHSKILSYPIELGFPADNSFYEINNSDPGTPQSVPNYNQNSNIDLLKLLEIPTKKPTYSTTWGKERSDPLGVRENYLEKNFYGSIKTNFDYDLFINSLSKFSSKCKTIADVYNVRHFSYFQAWENGKYFNDQTHIVMQDSGGIYLTNINEYFKNFEESVLIYPIRDVIGYVAAEKTRFARRFYGSRRFAWPQLPNYFVKRYDHYDVEALVKGWMCALTRVRLLQEKYGVNERFVTYNHDALTVSPEKTMEILIKKVNLPYEDTLINPTIAGKNWLGNSHYGPTHGISNEIKKNYKKVLRNDEFKKIEYLSQKLSACINKVETPVNLLDIPIKNFYNYNIQKKYFDDKEKLTLYYALTNSALRKYPILKVASYSISAVIYGLIVRVLHIPRLIKLKFFKGLGKQNYT